MSRQPCASTRPNPSPSTAKPWLNEAERVAVLAEKHARGDAARGVRNVRKERVRVERRAAARKAAGEAAVEAAAKALQGLTRGDEGRKEKGPVIGGLVGEGRGREGRALEAREVHTVVKSGAVENDAGAGRVVRAAEVERAAETATAAMQRPAIQRGMGGGAGVTRTKSRGILARKGKSPRSFRQTNNENKREEWERRQEPVTNQTPLRSQAVNVRAVRCDSRDREILRWERARVGNEKGRGADSVAGNEKGRGADAVAGNEKGRGADAVAGNEKGRGADAVAGNEKGRGADAVAGNGRRVESGRGVMGAGGPEETSVLNYQNQPMGEAEGWAASAAARPEEHKHGNRAGQVGILEMEVEMYGGCSPGVLEFLHLCANLGAKRLYKAGRGLRVEEKLYHSYRQRFSIALQRALVDTLMGKSLTGFGAGAASTAYQEEPLSLGDLMQVIEPWY
ncbi:unnamed protein product [Closterium sp. Yama58-4]|nr:unnamed protein product [Closterium sp. Yama58-4]